MNYTMLLLLITLGIGLIVIMSGVFKDRPKKERMKLTKIGVFFLAVGGVVGLLGFSGIVPQLQTEIDFGELAVAEPTPTVPTTGRCPPGSIEDATVTLLGQNKFTSLASGGTHRYRINGAPAQTVSDAGTFTASAGDIVEVLWMNGSAGSNYFSDVSTHTLSCSNGAPRLSREVYQNGTLTIEVFNEEGNLLDSAGENETLAAGDLPTLKANLKGTFERGFPWGGVIVAEYNSTEFDDIIVDFGGSKTNVPTFHTVSAVDRKVKAYTVPAILSNQILSGNIVLDASDSVDPIGAADAEVLYFYPNNYYINEERGGAFEGPAVEDEDGNQLSPVHTTSFNLYVD